MLAIAAFLTEEPLNLELKSIDLTLSAENERNDGGKEKEQRHRRNAPKPTKLAPKGRPLELQLQTPKAPNSSFVVLTGDGEGVSGEEGRSGIPCCR